MKNKIRQILREETSEFNPKMKEQLYKFMDFLTKDYKWYYETPWSTNNIWLINPKTKKWVLKLEEGENLVWFWGLLENFGRYFDIGYNEYEKFIMLWAKDVFNRRVYIKGHMTDRRERKVEDILKNGKQIN